MTTWAQEHQISGIVSVRLSIMIRASPRAFGTGGQNMRHFAPSHWLAGTIVERQIRTAQFTMTSGLCPYDPLRLIICVEAPACGLSVFLFCHSDLPRETSMIENDDGKIRSY